jgi:hypothetical protein
MWAAGGGTFSDEFALFRDHSQASFALLVQHGLAPAVANTLELAVAQAVVQFHAQHGYQPDLVQQQVFDAVDAAHGRDLWALLRYFNGG